MEVLGPMLYVLLVALLYYMWTFRGTGGLDQLIDRAEHEHHRVHKVISRHPRGGTWQQYQRWLDAVK